MPISVDSSRTVWRPSEAARQHGRAAVRWALSSGRWTQPHPRVLVTHTGTLTRTEQLEVAVLAGPRGTLLAGLTAAALHGLRGFETDEIHLVIPHHTRMPRLTAVVAHRSVVLGNECGVGRPPCTTFERSVIDGACWSRHERLARAVVLASVQQRLTTPGRLLQSVEIRGPVHGIGIVAESVADAAGGLDSLPERDFALLLKRAGLPAPDRQVPVMVGSCRYRLDAEFSRWGVCVEIDGAHHRDQLQSSWDMTRQNDLVVTGRHLLRFSSYQVRHESAYVAKMIRQALAAAG